MSHDELAAGRAAHAAGDWAAAHRHLRDADRTTLGPEDLRLLSTAAYLVGDRDTAIDARQAAHTTSLADGDRRAAARDAQELAMFFAERGEPAVGAGWVARASRLLEGEPEDLPERGHLLVPEVFGALMGGDPVAALDLAERIGQIGRTVGDADLVGFSLTASGRAMIYQGRVPDGLARLDEAMVALTTGEVSPIMAGHLYCAMVEGCQEVGDVGRMATWTQTLERWCAGQPGLVPFTGQCAVHRAQIHRVHGSFPEALEELGRAVTRYAANGMEPAVALALYERGEVLRLTGDLDGADTAFEEAAAQGHDPQPGRALLWLAQGRTAAAEGCVRRLLDEAGGPVARARVLGPAVEVLLAADDLDTAGSASIELTGLAESFGCDVLTAQAEYAAGQVALATGDSSGALTRLRRAWRCWIGIGGRYDAARARLLLAEALRALGDEVSAESELSVAARTFAELGAEPARREAERLLGGGLPDGLTAREAEVLRLVAAGRTNPQIAQELVLSEKTVARHLSNIFGKIGVASRTEAAAYAFAHRLT
ncbi:LuxR C-terminal-related transcriptional regulator [Ornithinimicrobium sp. F0845]|uniref:LuxR family transcriptional regulator n=1 Tax=Ornithinimicrobium sp. F0845 TaxID=2926412 RepID=UPI001FF5374C|nr:LuxR family transcriptional regulator [Ornithinimicrobium sp. F0845]MCK0112514.1 LuxR C-terminal-related transcriptional regulator [Ornithinimicrobium sp. F0845]